MEKYNILSQLIDYFKPKAHDAIDKITSAWEESKSSGVLANQDPRLEEFLINMIEGGGGVGGALKPFTKAIKPLRAGKETAKQAAKRKKYWGMKKQERGGYHLDEYGDDAYRLEKEYLPTGKKEGDFFKSLLDSFFD